MSVYGKKASFAWPLLDLYYCLPGCVEYPHEIPTVRTSSYFYLLICRVYTFLYKQHANISFTSFYLCFCLSLNEDFTFFSTFYNIFAGAIIFIVLFHVTLIAIIHSLRWIVYWFFFRKSYDVLKWRSCIFKKVKAYIFEECVL